jgi:hypothetical protein
MRADFDQGSEETAEETGILRHLAFLLLPNLSPANIPAILKSFKLLVPDNRDEGTTRMMSDHSDDE